MSLERNNQDLIVALKHLVGVYTGALQDLGDIPLACKPKPIVEEIKPKVATTQANESLHVQQNKHDVEIKKTLAPFNKSTVGSSVYSPKPRHNEVRPQLARYATTPAKTVDLSSISTLDDLKQKISETEICDLQKFATNTVFGDGNPNAKILIVGEAPGQEEDEQGIPFCGRSGQLLMNAFASIGLKRDVNFFITNNIFWRPPGNRKPTDEEMAMCKPYLEKIGEIIKPEVIICVGAVAAQNALKTQETISSLRGRAFPCNLGIETKAFCVYHPSYLLRNPSKKYEMYKDLLALLPSVSHLL